MTPNPILKVLSTFQKHRVRALLIGGQACIVYGAAEFSRDSDFVVLCTPANLARVRATLAELQAHPIYVPPLRVSFLRRGHACHFRCHAPGVERLRVDLMARLRGCDEFPALWRRRETVRLPEGGSVHVLGLRDLVQSKKTQRDKDWLMLRRLVDNDLLLRRERPQLKQVRWWLRECRTAENILSLARQYPEVAKSCAAVRPVLRKALAGDVVALRVALQQEEDAEREKDRGYWKPLRQELERLRWRRRA
ncbi:MAG: nucleotidyltransferase family protein [Planctomycetes bacterium]|nr:nucleotidyltransferase family protein [Planctomycetota bacterium]